MYKVVRVEQTCFACPSQWSGTFDDGHNVYVRYRWGHLSVRRSLKPKGDAVAGVEILTIDYGDGLDGLITYEQLKQATHPVIEWPEKELLHQMELDDET